MMELVGKLRACFFSCFCKGDARSRLGGAKYFVSTDLNLNRAFLLAWPVARKIYYSKRKHKQEKRGLFGIPRWPPFSDWFRTDQYFEIDFKR